MPIQYITNKSLLGTQRVFCIKISKGNNREIKKNNLEPIPLLARFYNTTVTHRLICQPQRHHV